jgi:hypothetical protein
MQNLLILGLFNEELWIIFLHYLNAYWLPSKDSNTKINQLVTLTFQSLAISVRSTRFNIQKFYMMLALRWVFCADLRTNSDFCFIHHQLTGFFITVVESVYSAVRTDSLHKADYASSLKG